MITILYNFEMKKLHHLFKHIIGLYSAMISIEQAQKLNLEY